MKRFAPALTLAPMALSAALLCFPSPAAAWHCQPKPDDWNDSRTIALSQSLPENLYVARCSGGVIDFLYPFCMERENIYDGVPCPPEVAALAAVLRFEHPAAVAWAERDTARPSVAPCACISLKIR
jgi:hypothetical protein